MSQYTDIKAALTADIKAAWSGVTVSFGRALAPFTTMPRAVVSLAKVQYSKSGIRSMDKTWTFQIAASFELSDSVGATELEPVQMGKIEAFIAQFLPESDSTVPAVNGAYAGISNRYMVSSFECVEAESEDQIYMVKIEVQIITETHV
jgi:hypothetical protein